MTENACLEILLVSISKASPLAYNYDVESYYEGME